MITNIFYGKSRLNNLPADYDYSIYAIPRNTYISISTPDISMIGNPKKLDILYYTNINRYGETLSTIVMISDVKDSDDTSPIIFNPNDTLNNSDLEKSIELLMSGSTSVNHWLNSEIGSIDADLLKFNSFISTHEFSRFSRDTDLASSVYNDNFMYDGWYTLVSVAPDPLQDDFVPTTNTILRYNASNELIEYYVGGIDPLPSVTWEPLSGRIIDSVDIGKLINYTGDENPYVATEFFIIKKSNDLYIETLAKKMDTEMFTRIRVLKPKMDLLYKAAYNKSFDLMQLIINSMEYELITVK